MNSRGAALWGYWSRRKGRTGEDHLRDEANEGSLEFCEINVQRGTEVERGRKGEDHLRDESTEVRLEFCESTFSAAPKWIEAVRGKMWAWRLECS